MSLTAIQGFLWIFLIFLLILQDFYQNSWRFAFLLHLSYNLFNFGGSESIALIYYLNYWFYFYQFIFLFILIIYF